MTETKQRINYSKTFLLSSVPIIK